MMTIRQLRSALPNHVDTAFYCTVVGAGALFWVLLTIDAGWPVALLAAIITFGLIAALWGGATRWRI